MLILKKLRENSFARQVSVLASGTAIAHLLAIGTLPLITRLYTPDEFGILGVFVALMSILTVVANWRYEIAVPLPDSDERAANLAAVALVCGFFTTCVTLIAVIFFGSWLGTIKKFSGITDFLILLPLGIFFAAIYAVFQYWATRRKEFSRIARTRVEQAVGGVGSQLIAGYLGGGALGLIIGQIINSAAGVIGLVRRAYVKDRPLLDSVNLAEMKSVAREYERFPKFSVLESLSNISAVQIPLILISLVSESAEVGYLMLGMRLMQAPVGLIGSSISQVFFVRAVEAQKSGDLHILLASTLTTLLKSGVGPLVFAGIVSPFLCGVVFGDDWKRAGELIAWMTPWFVFQFLSQPVSMVLHVTSSQRTALILQAFGLLLRVSSVLIFPFLIKEGGGSEAYALSGAIFYFVYLLVIIRAGGVHFLDLGAGFFRSGRFVLAWCAVAGLFLGMFSFLSS